MIKICYSCVATDDFLMLCDLLDFELNDRVGGANKRQVYEHLNTLNDIKNFYIAYDNGEAVGCACSKEYNSYSLEIKRVFVREDYRNRGIAKKIFEIITEHAISNNYTSLILETGKILYEALNLYVKLGFKVIPNYEPYRDLKYSICMEKILEKRNETI